MTGGGFCGSKSLGSAVGKGNKTTPTRTLGGRPGWDCVGLGAGRKEQVWGGSATVESKKEEKRGEGKGGPREEELSAGSSRS